MPLWIRHIQAPRSRICCRLFFTYFFRYYTVYIYRYKVLVGLTQAGFCMPTHSLVVLPAPNPPYMITHL